MCLHVEQSSKQEHNPLLQSFDILLLSSTKYKLTQTTHLLSQSEQESEHNRGGGTPKILAYAQRPRHAQFLHPNTHNEPMTVQAGPARSTGTTFFKRAKAKRCGTVCMQGHSWAF